MPTMLQPSSPKCSAGRKLFGKRWLACPYDGRHLGRFLYREFHRRGFRISTPRRGRLPPIPNFARPLSVISNGARGCRDEFAGSAYAAAVRCAHAGMDWDRPGVRWQGSVSPRYPSPTASPRAGICRLAPLLVSPSRIVMLGQGMSGMFSRRAPHSQSAFAALARFRRRLTSPITMLPRWHRCGGDG